MFHIICYGPAGIFDAPKRFQPNATTFNRAMAPFASPTTVPSGAIGHRFTRRSK